MAAIICDSIEKLCSSVGQLLCLPCKACGIGCDALFDILKSPFFPYIGIAVGLNLPPAILGFRTIADLGGDCSDAVQWLIVNGVFCLIHILAAFYIIHKIQVDRKSQSLEFHTQDLAKADHLETANANQLQLPVHDASNHSSWGRIKHVLCYDCGVALYIIIGVAWMCWMTVGISRYVAVDHSTCSSIGGRFLTSMICGYFFMSMGAFAFACSLCCLQPWH